MSTDTWISQKHRVVATADLEDKWWIIRFRDLDTVTQARRVSEIETMARDAAAVWLDIQPSHVDVDVTIATAASATQKWKHARQLAMHARDDERAAAALSRESVQDLRERGMTFADIASVLGVSVARAHQLARR
ncbi:hypothetical protein FB385_2500 [Paramicrobacterium agarici]|nr:hypothetical protein FB385_2500 [Microbacterium agarici]